MEWFIRASLWGSPECWPKQVGVNFVNKIHPKSWSTFVCYLYILHQTNARGWGWNILKYTWQYLINPESCFLHERSSVGILIGSLSNRTEVLYGFHTFLQMLVQSLTVCGDTLFSDIFQRVRNARLYFQLSDYPFLSHSFQFIIYYPSFTDVL